MSQDETRITLRTKLEKTAQKASNGDFTTVEYVDGKPEFRKPKKLGGAKKIWTEGFKARTVRGKVHSPTAPQQSFVYMPRFGIAGDRSDVSRILVDAGLREFADRLDRYTITYKQWDDFTNDRGDAEIFVDSRVNKDGHITSNGTARHFSDFWETTERTPGIRQKSQTYQETIADLHSTVDRIQGYLGTRSKPSSHRSPRRKDKKMSPKKAQRTPAETLRAHVVHALEAGKVYDVTDLRENGTGGRSTKVSKAQRTRVEIERGVVVSASDNNACFTGAGNYFRLAHGTDLPSKTRDLINSKIRELHDQKNVSKNKRSATHQKSDEEIVQGLNSAPGFVPKTANSRTGSPVRKQTPSKGAAKTTTSTLIGRFSRK